MTDGDTGMAEDLESRVRGLETAQATQAAAMTGLTGTMAATQAGNVAAVVIGSVSLIVGTLLGLTISKR